MSYATTQMLSDVSTINFILQNVGGGSFRPAVVMAERIKN